MNHFGFPSACLTEVFIDGKWKANGNFKLQIENIGCQEAIGGVMQFNSGTLLIFHLNYYLSGLIKVLNGGKFEKTKSLVLTCQA